MAVAEIWRKLGYTEEQSEELEMLSTINNDDIKNIDIDVYDTRKYGRVSLLFLRHK